MEFSPTTILSLVGTIVGLAATIASAFGTTLNQDEVKGFLETLVGLFFTVSNLVIYIRKLKSGEVKWFGGRKERV